MLTLYGIPNCDTCKKARTWLDTNSIAYQFHDVRVDGLEMAMLTRWAAIVGWQKLLNTRSTTWRQIPEAERRDINEKNALKLMLANPTLIKRPVLEQKEKVLVGFAEAEYRKIRG